MAKTGRITYIAKNYGPEALCKIVSTHFGVKVEKYLFFSMDNIQKMIDALGGVHITVTNAEARYLNNVTASPATDSTTPSMDKGRHLPVHWARGRDLHAHPQGGRRRGPRPYAAHAHGAENARGRKTGTSRFPRPMNVAVALTDNMSA